MAYTGIIWLFLQLINGTVRLWTRTSTGLQNLPKRGGFILAPNHSSYLDHFFLGAHVVYNLQRRICFIAKKEHFEKTGERRWHYFWHSFVKYIPIDRRSGKGETALQNAEQALKNNEIVVIYPEGTRTLTGKIQRGKTGVARLAYTTKVPVIPVGMIGTFDVMPKGARFPRFTRAELNIGKPIDFTEEYKKPLSKQLLRDMTTKIMKEIASLSNQPYNFEDDA